MFTKKIILLTCCLFLVTNNAISMEEEQAKVCIVDAYHGHQLKNHIGNYSNIAIFGTTPSPKRMLQFYEKLFGQYKYLIEHRSNNNSIKSVCKLKKVNKTYNFLANNNLLDDFDCFLDNFLDHHFSDSTTLFLENGIEQRTLKRNVKEVARQASNKNQVLIHAFLPSYFAGLPKMSFSKIHEYLACCAQYYKKLYEDNMPNKGCNIILYIPPLKHFTAFTNASNDANTKSDAIIKSICTVLEDEVFCKANDNAEFSLINQDPDEAQQLNEYLHDNYQRQTDHISFITYDRSGKRAFKNFTPYVLTHKDKQKQYESMATEIDATHLINNQTHEKLITLFFDSQSELAELERLAILFENNCLI